MFTREIADIVANPYSAKYYWKNIVLTVGWVISFDVDASG